MHMTDKSRHEKVVVVGAGINGLAISLVCPDEGDLLNEIEKVVQMRIPIEIIDGFQAVGSGEPRPTAKSAAPVANQVVRRMRPGRRPDNRRRR